MASPTLSIIAHPSAVPSFGANSFARLLDRGFGVNYELLVSDNHLTAALGHNQREQPLVARSLDIVTLCCCGVREILEPVLRKRELADREQTAQTLLAIQRLEIARAESRVSNSLIESLRPRGEQR